MLLTRTLTLCVLLCSTFNAVLHSQTAFQLTTSQADHTFEVNEQMSFNIKALRSGQATFSIHHNAITLPLEEGSLQLREGVTYKINFTLDYPGTVWFELKMDGASAITSATFAPFEIEPQEAEAEDFDAFWEEQKAQLAQIPIDAQVYIYQQNEYSTSYRVSLGMIDNRRVYGYISVPKGNEKYPAVLSLPSFGAAPNLVKPLPEIAERVGAISMSISIHNTPPDETVDRPYQPDNPAIREENYFRYAILASLRAIDYLESRADFSGKLAVTGVSQGGGLGIMVAGLDERVDLLVFSNPTHTEHQGLRYGIASGFPYYLEKVADSSPGDIDLFQTTAEAIKYYDAVYFAKRFKGTTLGVVGYEDQVCPAATTFAAFNQLRGEKILFHGTSLGHQHPNEYWKGQQDAFRRFLAPTENPPFPYASKEKGYFIDIGVPDEIYPNQEVQLQGVALRNEDSLTQNVYWEKVNGDGIVTFTSNQQLLNTATFSDTGTYKIQLKVEDRSTLAATGNFYTLIDELEIQVKAKQREEIFTVDCPENIVLSTSVNTAIINWELPNILVNTCENSAFAITQTQGLSSGSFFPIGTHIIEYEIKNGCGISQICSFEIEIVKEEILEVECPDDIFLSTTAEEKLVEWEWPKIVANNCERGGIQIAQIRGLSSGSRFPVGISTIEFEITNKCGLLQTCSFDIIIEQETSDTFDITCPKDIYAT
ncbi:MAG: acetylxylan esterase, partial [Bacteroidota bacterium]